MVKTAHLLLWITLLPAFLVHSGYSQSQKIIAAVDSFRHLMPVEKTYLHTDKPYYSLGDTLWYKSYLFNSDIEASAISKLLYVELCTDSGKVVLRQLIPVGGGLSWGNILLEDKILKAGTYTLRAYTNWMQNFGNNFFFSKQLQIYNPIQQNWLVNYRNELSNDTLHSHLKISTVNGETVSYHPVNLRIYNGIKTVYKGSANTNANGTWNADFVVPDNPGQLSLELKDGQPAENSQNLNFPLPLKRPEYTDLQFLPEGGNMVAGLLTRIGFKAVGEDGKSVVVSGKIYNSSQREVASFVSNKSGMGSFELLPEPGEKYIAKLIQPQLVAKVWRLPDVRQQGTVLRVDHRSGGDSVMITINAASLLPLNQFYYLTGQSRNSICYAAKVNLNSIHKSLMIPASAFPTGIARFSLLNEMMQPLNERLIFINHHDFLNISITPHQLYYKIRDSIAIAMKVINKEGEPVQGSFSLSVTDDGQVKSDRSANIVTHLLLTGDLKGVVENPACYFSSDDTLVQNDLDNLLLTQGWTGYDWKDVFHSKIAAPEYPAEQEYLIKGKVSNIFNKGVGKSKVTLLCKKPFFVMDTLTNAAGEFIFSNINPVDTALFFIQAKNKSGNSMNVGITVEAFKPPLVLPVTHTAMPWYVNTDTTGINYAKATVAKRRERLRIPEGAEMLEEVIVKGKKRIPGSLNLNGPGEADQVIDKEELEKAGKMTLGDLIRQKISGFKIGDFPIYYGSPPARLKAADPLRKQCYLIGDKQLRLIIDGIDVDFTYQEVDSNSKFGRFNYIKSYLDYYTAEDIKGIEVMVSKKYNNSYNSKVLPWEDQKNILNSNSDIAYLEITTRSGHGPFMKVTPGTYLHKPLPFSLPKQFYRPRYISRQKDSVKDVRSAIHWEPNVVTNINGKAVISFYSSDRAGTYTVRVEGGNMSGNIGAATMQLNIIN